MIPECSLSFSSDNDFNDIGNEYFPQGENRENNFDQMPLNKPNFIAVPVNVNLSKNNSEMEGKKKKSKRDKLAEQRSRYRIKIDALQTSQQTCLEEIHILEMQKGFLFGNCQAYINLLNNPNPHIVNEINLYSKTIFNKPNKMPTLDEIDKADAQRFKKTVGEKIVEAEDELQCLLSHKDLLNFEISRIKAIRYSLECTIFGKPVSSDLLEQLKDLCGEKIESY